MALSKALKQPIELQLLVSINCLALAHPSTLMAEGKPDRGSAGCL